VTYTIDFTATKTLLAGNDKLSFGFGAGTTFGTFVLGDITVDINAGGPISVPLANIATSGAHLEFLLPTGATIVPGDAVQVIVKKVKNPATPGDYTMTLDYEFACCGPEDFNCAEYTIIPKYSVYDFVWDSNPTYPGIAVGFVPPFKACGQNWTDGMGSYNIGAKFFNWFDLVLKPTSVGCDSPCADNVTMTLNLTAAPAGSTVSLNFSGTDYTLSPTTAIPQPQVTVGNFSLGFNDTITWNNAIHFDTVGDYQICVKAWCTVVTGCPDCLDETDFVADECFDISVYQWKEACKIELYRKWNLISLPLVPLEPGMPIEDVLASAANASLIKSIHHYDRCADAWSVWGNGQTSLSTLVDGDGYWVMVDYTLGSATKGPGLPIGPLWVWGTSKPVPPAGPSAYAVCDGWNMIGYTEGCPTTMLDSAYLWNFWPAGAPTPPSLYGAVYGWNAVTQTWDTPFAPHSVTMNPGDGFWVSFHGSGAIYPP
jgi:hypothetical protein